jgi:hypothetical protein
MLLSQLTKEGIDAHIFVLDGALLTLPQGRNRAEQRKILHYEATRDIAAMYDLVLTWAEFDGAAKGTTTEQVFSRLATEQGKPLDVAIAAKKKAGTLRAHVVRFAESRRSFSFYFSPPAKKTQL